MRRFVFPIATLSLAVISACSGGAPDPGEAVIAVKVSPDNPVVLEGAPIAFRATAITETGESKDVSDSPSTTWLSSDPGVVEVNADGAGEATGPGSAFVTARNSGITSPAQNVTVNPIPTTPPPTPTPTPAPTANHVVISEVVYDLTGSALVEFIEIFNPTGSPVVMDGWDVTEVGGTIATISTFTLPAGEYAAVARAAEAAQFNTEYGATAEIVLNFGALNDSGDTVFLRNAADVVIDQVSWGTVEPPGWCDAGTLNSGDAKSIARKPDGSDGDNCNDWYGAQTPSPDAANP